MLHFTGVPLDTLLRIGALAGAVVVVFYILKLRRRPVAVPFSKIWERVLRDKEATSLFSQLKRLLSLLLQLALLALLLLALGDPRPQANLVEGRNIVVLIDASASMQAIDVAPSRVELAKEEVRKMVRGLSGSDRMLLAQMDAAVTPLSTLTGEIADLEAAVAAVRPTDATADFARALRFAGDTLSGLPSPEIIVVSDGALGEPADAGGPVRLGDIKLSFVPIGKGSRNAAITEFSVRRYPLDKSRYEVMLEVTNTSDEPLDLELSLLGDGQLTDLTRIRLQPKEKLPRFYPNLSGASKTLEAKLALADGSSDDLPADNRAYALLPERRRARVQVVTAGNMFIEAALLLDEYLDVTYVEPQRYPAAASFDVTIFDGVAPSVAPGSGSLLYLNPTGTGLPFEVGKEILDDDPNYRLGFDELDAKHPLLRYTALSDVNIARARTLKGSKEDRVVGRSYKGPLLIEGRRSGVKFAALGFDIRESDFPLRIAWPLFLLNAINNFVEEDTSYISSFRTGAVWHIPASSSAETASLEQPDGTKRTVPIQDGRAVFLGQHAGFYTLRVGAPGAQEESMFAANLSAPQESAIAPVAELKVDGRGAGAVGEFKIGVRRELWVYLLAAVLLVTAIEWFTYHRRVTV
ncbi:vWA domain-containing protein [Sorangium sp. So ce1097]|uniref:vWA domain-containing protein n=1 Tax=Sorangium sp. So ce1097 TaxID=3133330 RepID=UPI003F60B83C